MSFKLIKIPYTASKKTLQKCSAETDFPHNCTIILQLWVLFVSWAILQKLWASGNTRIPNPEKRQKSDFYHFIFYFRSSIMISYPFDYSQGPFYQCKICLQQKKPKNFWVTGPTASLAGALEASSLLLSFYQKLSLLTWERKPSCHDHRKLVALILKKNLFNYHKLGLNNLNVQSDCFGWTEHQECFFSTVFRSGLYV